MPIPNDVLSIIIPIHNEADRILNLVSHLQDSCLGSSSYEIIIVESKDSRDGGLLCVPEREGILLLKSTHTCRARQMNEGAALARGKVLCFLHADVIPPKRFLDHIREKVNQGLDFGYFSYRFDSDNFLLSINSWFTRYDGIFTGGGDQPFFIRQSIFKKEGGYSDVELMEDFDLFYRLKRKHYKYCIIHDPAQASARKYKRNSYVKVNVVNGLTLLGYHLGVDVKRLKAFYQKWIR